MFILETLESRNKKKENTNLNMDLLVSKFLKNQ